jgi:hypothetical protein
MRTKLIEDFKATQVVYNRNGISGRPFWSVTFSCREESMFKPNMLAVIPHEGKEDECYVIDMNDVEDNWRGPHFFADVINAIDAYKNDRDR